MVELKNKPSKDTSRATSAIERASSDIVLGCDSGTLLFIELNAEVNPLARIEGNKVDTVDSFEVFADKVKFASKMRLPSREPVTHLHELEGPNQVGMLLLAQSDGNILIINFLAKTKILHLRL